MNPPQQPSKTMRGHGYPTHDSSHSMDMDSPPTHQLFLNAPPQHSARQLPQDAYPAGQGYGGTCTTAWTAATTTWQTQIIHGPAVHWLLLLLPRPQTIITTLIQAQRCTFWVGRRTGSVHCGSTVAGSSPARTAYCTHLRHAALPSRHRRLQGALAAAGPAMPTAAASLCTKPAGTEHPSRRREPSCIHGCSRRRSRCMQQQRKFAQRRCSAEAATSCRQAPRCCCCCCRGMRRPPALPRRCRPRRKRLRLRSAYGEPKQPPGATTNKLTQAAVTCCRCCTRPRRRLPACYTCGYKYSISAAGNETGKPTQGPLPSLRRAT